ncbi:DegT/DnrJ/EryC1/StrS family aminotransferase [Salisediminibacterium halotolerans]|uniref:dTDP-4-amino-4,6-dideoxygalactose transaminase n=1 Tax=Salisediminibacterium halotolerans TaxID=517425 RepID=A0A1H9QIT2_9BACI|nr:DegT/DnrJ/EryC1/StrS family aminotransferase [Salisediminibacterium haloalkalitolerans]SER60095.1 dTDP-4-amino-4,6-dideoxygalactose transaminase [Salisediminibacterium haloalkalitolerans]
MQTKEKPLMVTKPLTPAPEHVAARIAEVTASGQLTNNGPQHQKLEAELAAYLGVKDLTLFANGTLALILGLKALGLKGEVITTPFTFPATVQAIEWAGLTPVFADVDPVTFNLDPAKIEAKITEKTSAIVPVHVYGNPCDTAAITAIARDHDLRVAYDGAHAFGMTIDGRPSGSFGDLTMFSFHATKLFHTVEGGALSFNRPGLKTTADQLKNFGLAAPEQVAMSGMNAKMNDVQAAFGREVLPLVAAERAERQRIKAIYDEFFAGVRGIRTITAREGEAASYQYYVIEIGGSFGVSRDELQRELEAEQIFTRKYFYPVCTAFPWYEGKPGTRTADVPAAAAAAEQVLALPFYGAMTDADAKRVAEAIRRRQ